MVNPLYSSEEVGAAVGARTTGAGAPAGSGAGAGCGAVTDLLPAWGADLFSAWGLALGAADDGAGREFADPGTTCSTRLLPEHALSSIARIIPARIRMRGSAWLTLADGQLSMTDSHDRASARRIRDACMDAPPARVHRPPPNCRPGKAAPAPVLTPTPCPDKGGAWAATIPACSP